MKQPGTRQRWRPALILAIVALTGAAVIVANHGSVGPPDRGAPRDRPAVATAERGAASTGAPTAASTAAPAAASAAAPHPIGAADDLPAELDPEVVALRRDLDVRDVPESSACAVARDSERAAGDPAFARQVETICVAWRKLMWDYAEAHAAEVEAGDPAAIEHARATFVALDMGLMQELIRAGGGEPPDDPGADPSAPAPSPATSPLDLKEIP